MGEHKLEMVFLNPGTILGPNDFGLTPSTSFILLAMKKPTPVWFDGGHSYSDVEDVAEAHLQAEQRGRSGERYILAGENVSVKDSLDRIAGLRKQRKPLFKIGHGFVSAAGLGFEWLAKATGKAPLFTREKAHKLIDYYGYYSSKKAQEELGYQFRPFDEILKRSEEWYKKMGWL
jgi:dihydroflavonol-4-reductase